LLAWDEQPFASIWQLARLIHRWRNTVRQGLTQSLGLYFRRLRWVAHRLSGAQELNRVELSREFMFALRTQ
jgi:hypothetical protein